MKDIKFYQGNGGTFWIIVALAIALVIIAVYLKNESNYAVIPQNQTLPCVPAPGCHVSSCVFSNDSGAMVICTEECVNGTLDCGQGTCEVIDGKCEVKWKN